MTLKDNIQSLGDLLGPFARQTEADLETWLIEPSAPAELADGMRYCVAGGKRLRPAMVHLAAQATARQPDEQLVRRAAVAVELVHVYSLVHDDLPAMDDDELRRGQPTAHVKFGEAMAILIGDALQCRAFGLLGESASALAGRLVAELASAAGQAGMVAGQVADMNLAAVPDGFEGLAGIHLRKTAAMLKAATRMGAIAAGATDEHLRAVSIYAEKLGLAFQLFDDLLDATGTAGQLGKTPGKDAQAGKRTVITELGETKAKARGEELTAQAIEALAPLGTKGKELEQLAQLLTHRKH
ncbi:MAG: polyprenyl synthetase family protein [Phycisphaerae bacterium]|nr:polyprenyl synthetase family protein [Phycisphaerae bacterium]